MHIDVVVGNPPYQGAKKSGGPKGKPPTIWPRFVEIAAGEVTGDYLVMVHPAMYRKPGNPLQDILYHGCRELHMYNNAEAMQTFGASTRYDWYVVDKSYDGLTEVTFEDCTTHSIDLHGLTFLPNGSWTIWQRCAGLVGTHGALSPIKDPTAVKGDGPHKIIQTATQTKGVVLQGTSVTPKHADTKKVIISESGRDFAHYDDGEYGMGSNCYFIAVPGREEGATLVNFIMSKLGRNLANSCKWGNFRTERVIWEHVPDVVKMGLTPQSTDTEIYKAFGLTDAEVKFVETFEYGTRRDV